jgi:hypothetical protein
LALDESYPLREQTVIVIIVGGLLMLLESLWGVVAVLPFDWRQLPNLVVGISFVIGLPCYLLDSLARRRTLVFLPALLLYRWIALGLLVKPHTLVGPWRVCVLLILASLLLQWSKLRTPAQGIVHAERPLA